MPKNAPRGDDKQPAGRSRGHAVIASALAVLLAVESVLLLSQSQWLHAFLVLVLLVLTLGPLLLRRGSRALTIPSEVHLAGVAFAFAAIFLGEVRDYYERLWWWDDVLHGTAGLLLGLVGFMLVYALNENDQVDFRMRPGFVAAFSFFFSVGLGTLWEIFEYAMDAAFALTMQKPTPGDPTGLADTMSDLMLDAAGAALMAVLGWRYMQRPRKAYLDSWGRRFIERHPHLFER